ncbi:MAG TPA: hypothetical protein VK821_05770 [Dehalococcoidia bacterium]|nr:hypothetical protein [Dehalococcoidia bacterium]
MDTQTAVLTSGLGLGPRVLRFNSNTEVWFEGKQQPLATGMPLVNDLVNAGGTTLTDMSLDTKLVTINPMPNLLGAIAGTSGSDLRLYPRAGKQRGSLAPDPITIHATSATKFYKDRGNFQNANSSLSEAKSAGAVQVEGYYDRQGQRYALKVFYSNQLPPDDAPQWLLQKVGG